MSHPQILIASILREPRSVVIQRHNLLRWFGSALIFPWNTDLVFIDVVTKMDNVVDTVFTGDVTVCVGVAERMVRTREDS